MPGSASFHVSSKREYSYSRIATPFVVFVCITAGSGGLLFGYDLGISGGVSSMDDFLLKFFPKVYEKKHNAETDNYCKFDSQLLTLFTSSLYLASFITSFFASGVTRSYGRRVSILAGSICFLIGSALDGAAENLGMLILGRVILGVGLGFTNQAVPLYLSEMAPPKLRGGLATMFPLAISTGVTSAFLINYGTGHIVPWGWRLSLGLAFIPALIITIGCALLPDSPSSLIQRGYLDEGIFVLQRIRGTHDVQEEFNDLLEAMELSKSIQHPWRNILKRKYRPQLVMAFSIPFFQQVTGINIITFYAPVLFQTLGFRSNASLYSAVILGAIGIVTNMISAFVVDKYGRRKLFLYGGFSMFIFLVLTGILLQWKLGAHNALSKGYGIVGVLLICLFVFGFGWSWGPLAWLVPSEIFPLEIRSAGQSINISVIMFFVFVSAQAFLAMLCHLKAGIFFFFAGWMLVMTFFIYKLFPETRCVPLEEVANLWKRHPCWRIYYE